MAPSLRRHSPDRVPSRTDWSPSSPGAWWLRAPAWMKLFLIGSVVLTSALAAGEYSKSGLTWVFAAMAGCSLVLWVVTRLLPKSRCEHEVSAREAMEVI